MAVEPTGQDLERLLADDHGGPIVMLNLLRFAPGGQEVYREYARILSARFLDRYGAEVIYAGLGATTLVAEDGQDWDAVVLVWYPNREAFSRMVADPAYRDVTTFRTAALSEAVWQATVPWQPSAEPPKTP